MTYYSTDNKRLVGEFRINYICQIINEKTSKKK